MKRPEFKIYINYPIYSFDDLKVIFKNITKMFPLGRPLAIYMTPLAFKTFMKLMEQDSTYLASKPVRPISRVNKVYFSGAPVYKKNWDK